MASTDMLLKPEECAMLLVDFQAGLAFGVESRPRQVVHNNAVALARTAVAFNVPVIASTSASRVYSGPLLPALQEALPSIKAIERKSMNVWEDDAARNAVVAVQRMDGHRHAHQGRDLSGHRPVRPHPGCARGGNGRRRFGLRVNRRHPRRELIRESAVVCDETPTLVPSGSRGPSTSAARFCRRRSSGSTWQRDNRSSAGASPRKCAGHAR